MLDRERNIDAIVVRRAGRVEEVRGGLVPYRLVDGAGADVAAVSEFLRNMTASGLLAGDGVNAHHNPLRPWKRPGKPAPCQPRPRKCSPASGYQTPSLPYIDPVTLIRPRASGR